MVQYILFIGIDKHRRANMVQYTTFMLLLLQVNCDQ